MEDFIFVKVDWDGDDDNEGYIYGIEFYEKDTGRQFPVEVAWFKTREDRDETFKTKTE